MATERLAIAQVQTGLEQPVGRHGDWMFAEGVAKRRITPSSYETTRLPSPALFELWSTVPRDHANGSVARFCVRVPVPWARAIGRSSHRRGRAIAVRQLVAVHAFVTDRRLGCSCREPRQSGLVGRSLFVACSSDRNACTLVPFPFRSNAMSASDHRSSFRDDPTGDSASRLRTSPQGPMMNPFGRGLRMRRAVLATMRPPAAGTDQPFHKKVATLERKRGNGFSDRPFDPTRRRGTLRNGGHDAFSVIVTVGGPASARSNSFTQPLFTPMELIPIPCSCGMHDHAAFPEGLTDRNTEPCPFTSERPPRSASRACCAIDAGEAVISLRAFKYERLANELFLEKTHLEAEELADELRRFAERTVSDTTGTDGTLLTHAVENWERTRRLSARIPTFVNAIGAIREVSTWLEIAGASGFGVEPRF